MSFDNQKELLKSLARIISGSHIAFRMELKEKIIVPFIELLQSLKETDMADALSKFLSLIGQEEDFDRFYKILESLDYLEKNFDLENLLDIADRIKNVDINFDDNEQYQTVLKLIELLNNSGASDILHNIFDLSQSNELGKDLRDFVDLLESLNNDDIVKLLVDMVDILREDRENKESQQDHESLPNMSIKEMEGEKLSQNQQDKDSGGPKLE